MMLFFVLRQAQNARQIYGLGPPVLCEICFYCSQINKECNDGHKTAYQLDCVPNGISESVCRLVEGSAPNNKSGRAIQEATCRELRSSSQ